MSQQPMKRYRIFAIELIDDDGTYQYEEGDECVPVYLAADVEAVELRNVELQEIVDGDKAQDVRLWQILNEAAAAIKAGDKWPANHWPSPVERCWHAAAQEHIKELQHALAAKEAFKEEVEVVAQVNGWPGYSQGGHPAKYLNDTIAELQAKVAIQPSRGEQG